jgi:hypothetical protein
MPEVRVPCDRPACAGFFEDEVAWPGTISMRSVPQRVVPVCNVCGADLAGPWSARLDVLVW